jgi:RimJ/RimL family protein N-acetyltransferase
MRFPIRPAREADAPAIIAVLNPIIAAGSLTIMDAPLTVAEQVAFMRGFPARGIFNVAACDEPGPQQGTVLGLQSIEPIDPADAGEIATFVSLDAHRRGVGRALTEATLAQAKRLGYRTIIATVRADNPRAIAFYQAQGFVPAGAAKHQPRNGGTLIDQVVMGRSM